MDELEPSFVVDPTPWSPDRSFLARADRRSAIRLSIQLGIIGGLVAASVLVPALAPLVLVPLAACLAASFAPFHECLHRTAFASRVAGEVAGAVLGLLFLASPAGYRAFHFAHHRHTSHPELDPEIAASPDFIGRWPRGPVEVLARLSGLGIALGKLAMLFGPAFVPTSRWGWFASYVATNARHRVAWETRGVLLWAALVVWGATVLPGLWVLPAAWALSHVFLGYWLTTEHTGLDHRLPILARTRTVELPGWLAWWVWSMNLHAEHHAWPAVPWHRLPEVHVHAQPPETWPSYLAIWRAKGSPQATSTGNQSKSNSPRC